MFEIKSNGDWSNTLAFFKRMKAGRSGFSDFNWAGRKGVFALAEATPRDTGETADSWDYRIVRTRRGFRIEWFNTHVNKDVPIAIIIQYGHGTGDGSWVEGIDYVNPAMVPVFDAIAADIWKQVKA